MERVRVTVFDTTLRDGEQSPGCSMNVHEKLRMAHQLDRLGVDVIEAGFPIASDGDFEAVLAIAAVVQRPIIAGLARTCTQDIERAWQALKRAAHPRIHTFLATSDIHLKYKLRISQMTSEKMETCLAIHGLVEMILAVAENVPFEKIDEWDMEYEKARAAGHKNVACGCELYEEPGDDPHAPYHNLHVTASKCEKLVAEHLQIDWQEYEKAIEDL